VSAGGLQKEQRHMAEGTVRKKSSRGFGFIRNNRGSDIYFEMSAVDGISFADLREGQRVSFNETRLGSKPRAENVKPI
jgi:CspA family cold shock protein